MMTAFDPAQHLLDRAAELRTFKGQVRARWHAMDAEMVASELERQAVAIRRRLTEARH